MRLFIIYGAAPYVATYYVPICVWNQLTYAHEILISMDMLKNEDFRSYGGKGVLSLGYRTAIGLNATQLDFSAPTCRYISIAGVSSPPAGVSTRAMLLQVSFQD